MERHGLSRRRVFGAALGAGTLAASPVMAKGPSVAFIYDTRDAVTSPPALKAAAALEDAVAKSGLRRVRPATADAATVTIVVTTQDGPAESFSLARAHLSVVVAGSDGRGLSYALYELARRIRTDPATAFDLPQPVTSRPINAVRSVMRQFTAKAYDTAWFHDRAFWPDYLAMLAENRFNRLHLAFGLGYDSLTHVADSEFLFTYPFLIDVPGYGVSVTGLTAEGRARNLESLRFISEQTVAHGLDFQLGLWMHGYQWPEAPGVATIAGLTPDSHADYCRDAMTQLLRALPAVSSVALRIHGESGVKEGSYGFWKEVFAGVGAVGRGVEIDLHAKGVDLQMIDNALATGMPVNVSPKYWGEHLGLPYHQASIRAHERPQPGQVGQGLMTLSEGARSFTRYGYADLLRDDRRYTVRHRVFPGTQHILASGNGSAYASYGRMFGFCGSTGADLMEPLTYRGRRGTATATPRDGYAAGRMQANPDWRKYEAWYRSFGLGLHGGEAVDDDPALAAASCILPLVTTAYCPSAACDAYWPEVYWNQPLAAEPSPNPYGDTAAPKVFDNASPLDPQLFSSMREHAAVLLGAPDARISPVLVATQLETLADRATAAPAMSVDDERLAVDIAIQAGLGRFFAAKFRAGVLYALHDQTRDGRALKAALAHYDKARDAWVDIAATANGVYGDLSSSDMPSEHGAWADKLILIDSDIAALRAVEATDGMDEAVAAAISAAQQPSVPKVASLGHTPPATFVPGSALDLVFTGSADTAILWYRHVNQAETWQSVPLTQDNDGLRGTIPADYTSAPYPLQYYVEVRTGLTAALYPGLSLDSPDLPYFVVVSA